MSEIFTGLQMLHTVPSAANPPTSLPLSPSPQPPADSSSFPAELAEPQGSRSKRQVLEHLPSY